MFETLQDSKLAENHIIICGMVENMRNFVMPLRAKHLKTISPIVILHEHTLSMKQWQQLQYFTQIYFVRGSTLSEQSFDRTNIMKASQVVILTPAVTKQQDDNETPEMEEIYNESEKLRDSKTIFIYNVIKKKNP